MPDRPRDSGSSAPSGRWLLICLLLLPAVVVPLIVPLYDKADPTLFGFPFYYWFQFALIVFSALLTVVAYYLGKAGEKKGDRW